MKYAKSLRYGGILVCAVECTHESYTRLGLICDNCGSPVYFNAGAERQNHKRKLKSGEVVDVKGADIESYFCHFQAKGIEQEFAVCELRVKSLKPQDVQKRAIASKNQRLKKFQQHFWKVLKFNAKMATVEEDIEFAETPASQLVIEIVED